MADRSGVYLLEFKTGIYIGSSKHIRRRVLRHLADLRRGTHSNGFMQSVHDRHGAPTMRVLIECRQGDLLMYEQLFLDGFRPRLNLSPTAGRNVGHRHAPETLRRMSESGKAAWVDRPRGLSADIRDRIRRGQIGKVFSAETRAKISAAIKGRVKSAETCAKISASKKGKPRLFYAGKPWVNEGRLK